MLFLALSLFVAVQSEPIITKVGGDAPAFSLPGTNGKTVSLADFKGKKQIVLAFFPKAFSGACTKEMAALRDHQKMLDEANAQVIGISMDSPDVQKKFADTLKLTFPIVSDKDGRVARAYGVMGALWPKRATFVISDSGKIAAVFEGKDAVDPGPTVSAVQRKPVP
jgi:thioredoxin-dependent peroxiredoxin